MPAPYDYSVPQPNVGSYFQAFAQGRQNRLAQEQDTRDTALRKYLPAAAQGDRTAQQQVMQIDPETGMKLQSSLREQSDADLVRQKNLWDVGGALLQGVKPGDLMGLNNAKAQLVQLGAPPDFVQGITFEQIPQLVAMSPTVQKYMSAELDRRVSEANIRQSDAATAASRANAAGGGTDAYPAETLRAMALQYLAGDRSVMQNLGRGKSGERAVRDLRNMIQTVAVERGMNPTQIASKLAEYGGYQSGLGALGTRQANIDTAAAEANNFAELSISASNRVPRGRFVPLNQLVQAGQVMTSDPALADFAIKAMSLANAAATVAGRGTTNQFLQEEYMRQLSTAPDAASYEARAKAIIQEAKAVSKSTRDVRGEMVEGFTGVAPGGEGAKPSIGRPGVLRYDSSGRRIP